jgi:LmbE family N-acetylglucosaminyl deacetylase
MLRLMCVTAHPDDESGAFGGTLSLYHDRGVETYVVCLTPGQAATHRGGARSDAEMAAMRREEFAAACGILHVTRGVVLDYPDRQLHRLEPDAVARDLVCYVRMFRPHVLITFGPEGGVTAHTDHGMASIFAMLAYQWAGRSNQYEDQFADGVGPHRTQKLYFVAADFTLPEREPVALPPITAEIEIGAHLETKIAAFRAHASQAPLFPVFEGTLRGRGTKEFFHLAARTDPGSIERETDLFAGVREAE